MNKAILVGRVEYDPRYNDNANTQYPPVLNMLITTTHRYKGHDGTIQERSQKIKAALWGKLAELYRDLRKGSLVTCEGRLQNRQVQDKDGHTHWETSVVANTFEVLDGVSEADPENAPLDPSDEFTDDDIPF